MVFEVCQEKYPFNSDKALSIELPRYGNVHVPFVFQHVCSCRSCKWKVNNFAKIYAVCVRSPMHVLRGLCFHEKAGCEWRAPQVHVLTNGDDEHIQGVLPMTSSSCAKEKLDYINYSLMEGIAWSGVRRSGKNNCEKILYSVLNERCNCLSLTRRYVDIYILFFTCFACNLFRCWYYAPSPSH